MKICIVGNSHSACVFGALKHEIGFQDVTFDSFVVPGQTQPRLRTNDDGHFFYAGSMGLRSSVGEVLNVHDFDVIYICAFSFGSPLNKSIKRTGHILCDLQPKGWVNPDKLLAVNRAVFKTHLKQLLSKTGVPSLLRRLAAQGYQGQIITQLPPPISEDALLDGDWILRTRWGDKTEEHISEFMDMTYECGREIIAHTRTATLILPVPSQTLNGSLLRREYAHADKLHGNVEYGIATLMALRGEIGGPEITAPSFFSRTTLVAPYQMSK